LKTSTVLGPHRCEIAHSVGRDRNLRLAIRIATGRVGKLPLWGPPSSLRRLGANVDGEAGCLRSRIRRVRSPMSVSETRTGHPSSQAPERAGRRGCDSAALLLFAQTNTARAGYRRSPGAVWC
jgi:hypothetical protein